MTDLREWAGRYGLQGKELLELESILSLFARFGGADGSSHYLMGLARRQGQDLERPGARVIAIFRNLLQANNVHPAEAFEVQGLCAALAKWEHYFRASLSSSPGGRNTRNIRDMAFYELLTEARTCFYGVSCVWAHNSHLGDARATEMGRIELNLGQVARETLGSGAW